MGNGQVSIQGTKRGIKGAAQMLNDIGQEGSEEAFGVSAKRYKNITGKVDFESKTIGGKGSAEGGSRRTIRGGGRVRK